LTVSSFRTSRLSNLFSLNGKLRKFAITLKNTSSSIWSSLQWQISVCLFVCFCSFFFQKLTVGELQKICLSCTCMLMGMLRFKPEGRVLPIMDYTGMLRPKGIPLSATGMGKGPFFRLEVCEKGTFSGKGMWKGVLKGSGPWAEQPRVKSVGVPLPPRVSNLEHCCNTWFSWTILNSAQLIIEPMDLQIKSQVHQGRTNTCNF